MSQLNQYFSNPSSQQTSFTPNVTIVVKITEIKDHATIRFMGQVLTRNSLAKRGSIVECVSHSDSRKFENNKNIFNKAPVIGTILVLTNSRMNGAVVEGGWFNLGVNANLLADPNGLESRFGFIEGYMSDVRISFNVPDKQSYEPKYITWPLNKEHVELGSRGNGLIKYDTAWLGSKLQMFSSSNSLDQVSMFYTYIEPALAVVVQTFDEIKGHVERWFAEGKSVGFRICNKTDGDYYCGYFQYRYKEYENSPSAYIQSLLNQKIMRDLDFDNNVLKDFVNSGGASIVESPDFVFELIPYSSVRFKSNSKTRQTIFTRLIKAYVNQAGKLNHPSGFPKDDSYFYASSKIANLTTGAGDKFISPMSTPYIGAPQGYSEVLDVPSGNFKPDLSVRSKRLGSNEASQAKMWTDFIGAAPGQQVGNQQVGNQQMGNQQMGNQQMGNQQMGGQQMGGQQMGGQQMGGQQMDNQSMATSGGFQNSSAGFNTN